MADGPLLILRSMGVAILIGALIGLEREYHHRLNNEKAFAGLRTFMFYSVLGNLATWISKESHTFVLPVAFLGLILLLAATYFRGAVTDRDRGMTTEVAALLTFLLGCLVAVGETVVAVALGVVIASLLSAKPTFLRWVEKLTPEDIYTTLKFAVVSFVVLPLLPDRSYGPLASFNPHEIWIMVVLISAVSFLGYVSFKLMGPKHGVALSGLLGGLASSTAVAVAFSRRSKENPALSRSCAMAVVVASTVMVGRIAALVAVVFPALFVLLWIPLAVMGMTGASASYWLWRGARRDISNGETLDIRNPFRLAAVLTFAGAYAVVLLLVNLVREFFPDGSTAVVAMISGLTQVDAITLSVANLAKEDMPITLAVSAIVIAALSNTISKAVIAVALGHTRIRRPLFAGLGAMFVSGLLILPFLPYL